MHSEAAALLLIWSANFIKLYACFKKLKMDEVVAEKNASFKIESLAGVATQTKVMLKRQMEENAVSQQKQKD